MQLVTDPFSILVYPVLQTHSSSVVDAAGAILLAGQSMHILSVRRPYVLAGHCKPVVTKHYILTYI